MPRLRRASHSPLPKRVSISSLEHNSEKIPRFSLLLDGREDLGRWLIPDESSRQEVVEATPEIADEAPTQGGRMLEAMNVDVEDGSDDAQAANDVDDELMSGRGELEELTVDCRRGGVGRRDYRSSRR